MVALIFSIILVLSLGGMLFIVARKLPVLASLAIESKEKAESILSGDVHKKREIFFVKTEKIKIVFNNQKVAQLKSKFKNLKNIKIKRENQTKEELQKLEEIDKGHDYWEKIKRHKFRKNKNQ